MMKIAHFLSPSDVAIEVHARDKSEVLRELSSRAASALKLPASIIIKEIKRRDELGSTGIGGGASMPHARFRELKQPFGLLVRLKQPSEFGDRWATGRYHFSPFTARILPA